jgi:hypothetical protein
MGMVAFNRFTTVDYSVISESKPCPIHPLIASDWSMLYILELTPSLLRRVERGARGHEGVGTQRSLPPEHVDVPLST